MCHSVERSTTYLKQYVNLKVASYETWVGMKPDFRRTVRSSIANYRCAFRDYGCSALKQRSEVGFNIVISCEGLRTLSNRGTRAYFYHAEGDKQAPLMKSLFAHCIATHLLLIIRDHGIYCTPLRTELAHRCIFIYKNSWLERPRLILFTRRLF